MTPLRSLVRAHLRPPSQIALEWTRRSRGERGFDRTDHVLEVRFAEGIEERAETDTRMPVMRRGPQHNRRCQTWKNLVLQVVRGIDHKYRMRLVLWARLTQWRHAEVS